MSDAERVKGLLDGTVDPSELEGDPELYSLAERVYGREALDTMGIAAPVVPTVNIEDQNYTNGNNLEVELPDEPEEQEVAQSTAKRGKSRITLFAGILGLILIGFNVAVGIGALVELCEDPPTDLPIEFNSVATMQEEVLHVRWTITNMNSSNTYSVEWTISENGSQIVVDSDIFNWTAQDTYIHSENSMIEQRPWCYISTLYENGTAIATSNGCENDLLMVTMANSDSSDGECDDKPRLLWTELSEYENPNSWASAGSGDLLDGALLMLFGMITISGLKRRAA